MILRYDSASAYELAWAIVSQPFPSIAFQTDAAARVITVDNPELAQLLQSIEQTPAGIVPILGPTIDTWLVAGKTRRETERAWYSIQRFVFPTYAELRGGHRFAQYETFSSSASAMQVAAQPLYEGFIALESAPHQRPILLKKFALWNRLWLNKPSLKITRAPTYAQLLARFYEALALHDFGSAEQVLAELQQHHLVTIENLLFLKIQLWARQAAWQRIYTMDAFARLAVLGLPREIRRVLLIAFHHQILLELEQRGAYAEALERFQSERNTLGLMLTGYKPMTDSPVVRVFAYQAVAMKDHEAFQELESIAGLDNAACACLHALRSFLPVRAPTIVLPLGEQLRNALEERNYDTALHLAEEIPSRPERTRELFRIAMRYPDAKPIVIAAYNQLSPDELRELELLEPMLDIYLDRFLHVSAPIAFPRTWADWFERLVTAPRDAQLPRALDHLIEQAQSFDISSVRVLRERIAGVVEQSDLSGNAQVRRALEALIDALLKEVDFPNPELEYRSLYSLLFDCLLLFGQGNKEQTEKLLRLARVVIEDSLPRELENTVRDFKEWFGRPSPFLENQLLDAFDLLINYGARREHLLELYRNWLETLLDRPQSTRWERTQLELWLAFGEWLESGEDLLQPLRKRLSVLSQVEPDPVSTLPDGFRLSIFTLDPRAAERAKTVLMQRNPKLEVRICAETDMNRTVESLARNCDAAVIVTMCLTHAIFYGVEPLLSRKPIYPKSPSAGSIVRAVEDFIRVE